MAILYTMCGLPGAGKSTFTKKHGECVVVSSDAIRAELYGSEEEQGDGAKVFAILNKRVAEALADGHDVIYDATNVTRKGRRAIIKRFDAVHVCVFINTSKDECIRRNANRTRHVPVEVIEKMAERLAVPTIAEGFSKIIEIKG